MVFDRPRLLVIDRGRPLPPGIRSLIETRRCHVTAVHDPSEAQDEAILSQVDAVVIASDGSGRDRPARDPVLHSLLACLDERHISTLLLDEELEGTEMRQMGLCRVVRTDAPAEELWGRLNTLVSLRPWVRHMETELTHLHQLGARLNQHFAELDQEMRLASRLQRDFLPQELPNAGPVRFATLFRPASWVSGDIYDVFRIDDRRIGFYIADAVGHGLAASLLTMVVKYALLNQWIGKPGTSAACPSTNIQAINLALTSQGLPNCQFVTACYCVLDVESLVLSVARGGHPHPIHIAHDGSLSEIEAEGSLLGILRDQEFPTITVQLSRGDKVVLFSDGIELALVRQRDPDNGTPIYEQEFQAIASLSARQMIDHLGHTLDREEGSLNPRDDVTIVVAEIQR